MNASGFWRRYCITFAKRVVDLFRNRDIEPLPIRDIATPQNTPKKQNPTPIPAPKISKPPESSKFSQKPKISKTSKFSKISQKAEIVNPTLKKSKRNPKKKSKKFQSKDKENKEKEKEKIPMEVEAPESLPKPNFLEIFCPYCAGKNFVKRGLRQKKREKVQLYLCRDCRRTFTPGAVKGRHYPMEVILDAISLYNLGYSLEKAGKIAKKMEEEREEKQRPKGLGLKGTVSETSGNIRLRSLARATADTVGNGTATATSGNIGSGMVSTATVLNWTERYRHLCTFTRMREFALKILPPAEMISSATLAHRQLYRFRHHRAKTILAIKEDFKNSAFWPLKDFLDLVPVECPHQYFSEGLRASEAPLAFSKTEMIVRGKNNFANKIAKFALQSATKAKDRHDVLQRFMLANDSVTVATEVPVYLRREDLAHMQTQLGFELYRKIGKGKGTKGAKGTVSETLGNIGSGTVNATRGNVGTGTANATSGNIGSGMVGTGTVKKLEKFPTEEIPKLITGHIDFIQIRNGMIHILDYKPKAAKERPIEQLTIYALALSRLTGLRVYHFKCAWFDEKDYFEFFPLHVVSKPGKRRYRRKIRTIEGTYKLNDDPLKVASIKAS